jgi:ATP-dependent RNA helicase DDX52/ROK1
MDTFRLLSRSSSFKQKSGENRKKDAVALPSRGASSNPQLYGNIQSSNIESTKIESTDKKRKRQKETWSRNGQPLGKSSSTKGSSRAQSRKIDDQMGKAKQRYTSKSATAQRAEEELFTETECKSILRGHKLKITRLALGQDQTHLEDGKSSRAKQAAKSHENIEHTKKDFQLFPQPLLAFEDLRTKYTLSRRLASNIQDQGFSVPTEVQLGSLPLTLQRQKPDISEAPNPSTNRIDLLTVAPTGSGKTLAFMIPLLDGLMRKIEAGSSQGPNQDLENDQGIKAVVIAPTKELANQIVNEGRKLAKGTGVKVIGMRKNMILRGTNLDPSTSKPQELTDTLSSEDESGPKTSGTTEAVKADILITTPLSLVHALQDGNEIRHLPSVQHLVLDEADVLLDPLFRSQTLDIWNACTNPSLRTSLWSATMGASIEELARSTIQSRHSNLEAKHGPVPRGDLVRLVVGLKDSAIPNISHKLVYAATEQGKLLALRQLLHPSPSTSTSLPLRPPFLVFTQTIPRAIALHSELLYDIPPEAGGSSRMAVLHSDLSDTARSSIMTRFRRGEVWILITTDLLSRGVDFRGINGVVNYDVPTTSAAYIHRVGRTGRAGRDGGVAVTLYTKEDIPHIKGVANVIRASEGGKDEGEVRKWLLDALPTPGKELKKRLKRFGVEARRAGPLEKGDKERKRARISTKSGFDRRIERNRKDAAVQSRRRVDEDINVNLDVDVAQGGSEDEWGGLED